MCTSASASLDERPPAHACMMNHKLKSELRRFLTDPSSEAALSMLIAAALEVDEDLGQWITRFARDHTVGALEQHLSDDLYYSCFAQYIAVHCMSFEYNTRFVLECCRSVIPYLADRAEASW